MTSIYRDIPVAASPDAVWKVVRDVGHCEDLAPGFVTACTLKDGVRTVTFANGMMVHEPIVDVDDSNRRLAYGSIDGRPTHYGASITVVPRGSGASLQWRIDLLPDALGDSVRAMVDAGAAAISRRFGT